MWTSADTHCRRLAHGQQKCRTLQRAGAVGPGAAPSAPADPPATEQLNLKYGAEESNFGRKTAADLPVDAHELLALCAPRLTFISYGIPERGDAKWLDQQGSYMAAVAAQPVFRLLGAKGLGVSDDHMKEKMPAVNVGLLDGQLAWRQHDGGHTDGPNWKYFIPWADKFLTHSSSVTSASR